MPCRAFPLKLRGGVALEHADTDDQINEGIKRDLDEMISFAKIQNLSEPKNLKLDPEKYNHVFAGGNGAGLDDPRLAYFMQLLPEIKKKYQGEDSSPLQEFIPGDRVVITPQDPPGEPYNATVVDLSRILNSQTPSHEEAKSFLHNRFKRTFETFQDPRKNFTEEEFLRTYYPEVDSGILDLVRNASRQEVIVLAELPDGLHVQSVNRALCTMEERGLPARAMLDATDALLRASLAGDSDKVEALLAAGARADLGHPYKELRTGMHEAAAGGHAHVLALLARHGGEAGARDRMGRTPLHMAAGEGNDSCVALLLQLGAPPHTPDSDGRTPLHHAALCCSAGRAPLSAAVCRTLVRCGVPLEVRDSRLRTPLHLAADQGNAESLEALLDLGADPAACDADGRTVGQLCWSRECVAVMARAGHRAGVQRQSQWDRETEGILEEIQRTNPGQPQDNAMFDEVVRMMREPRKENGFLFDPDKPNDDDKDKDDLSKSNST